MTAELIEKALKRVARRTANSSTLRNQGAPGVVRAARAFLVQLDPTWFVVPERRQFEVRLNAKTDGLRNRLPKGARNWGAARKALNLFLRGVLYHTYLAKAYGMARVRQWLEVPLDSYLAKGLADDESGVELPRWPGIKHLQPAQSALYQRAAASIARRRGVARIDLDLWYWRGDDR